MKIHLNYISGKNLKMFLLLLTSCIITLWGCKKDENVRFSTDLAINSNIIRIADKAQTTRILVYSDGDWQVRTENEAAWLSLDKTSGSGKGEILATVESNSGNLPRSVNILISSGNKTDTIDLQQRGITPAIGIVDATAIGIANGGEMKTTINTNVPLELMEQLLVYSGTDNWISGVKIEGGYLKFTLAQNSLAEMRQAKLKLIYKDALGAITTDSLIVSQNPKIDFDNAILKDFAYVKNVLAEGEITEDIYIEGVVVSDKGNPNMGLNANRATNKHQIDPTENTITAYIQSVDGKSGLHIRTKTGGDNIFERNERIKLYLKGIILRKESNPARSILEEVQSVNIISKVDGPAVAPREIYMKDLQDNDLYTYVKLKEVEISVPSGSFFNINEGYNLRTSVYPANIRDINGNSMYMLTNIDVPYRRDGNRVPQGSGDISGILVNENLPRYGGNIGRYSIRHLTREDIALRENGDDGFSTVLAEWSRFKTENANGATETLNPLTPDIGTGKLTQSQKPALNFTTNGIYAGVDFNGLIQDPTTVKGVINNGGWASKTWWNDSKNIGASWNIQVSTAGITKPISLQIEGYNDIGGPRNFIVEWSSTGLETGTWNQVGEYTLEDVTNFSNTLLTQVPGAKVVNFQFPLAASNINSLYIRLRVKNKVVGTTTSPSGGTLNANGVSRLVHLSIKYNK